ncbi:uncharacterized protein N7487_008194 [Penicillium crustosum]|uniref:uncharacterized protein n=1 Tax=Penicillium crustosum TaxID=36656 RepID=UPI00239F599A|nr:uncharacterized protein N7487_008194 [Penicillium crustosum]KAJ5402298.1 hypothetical protein N7487_008194 [Penicillium crustosum]
MFGVHVPKSGTNSGTVTEARRSQVVHLPPRLLLPSLAPKLPAPIVAILLSPLAVTAGDSSSAQIHSNIDRQAIDTSWSHSTNGTTSICQIKGDDAALWGCAVHRHPSLGEGSLPTATGPSTLVRQSFIANGSLITSSTIFDQSGLNSRMASEKQQKRSQ